MSELSSPQIGTREYFETRIIPPNTRKQALLMKLHQKVWSEVAMQLPEDSRPNEAELSDLKLLKNNNAWSDLFHNKDRNKSIFEKVQTNIIFHQMESLQWDNKQSMAYNFLLELRDSIYDMDGYLNWSEYDENTKKMWKEWAHNFIDSWIEAFENRQYLPAEDSFDDSGREENWTLQKQLGLLTNMYCLSDESKAKLIKEICLQLPSYPGTEFHWDDMQEIYDDIVGFKK